MRTGLLFAAMALLTSAACAHHEVVQPVPVAEVPRGAKAQSTGLTEATPPTGPTPSVQSSVPSAAKPKDVHYVCPMHPEITANAAGECSRCGMALVAQD